MFREEVLFEYLHPHERYLKDVMYRPLKMLEAWKGLMPLDARLKYRLVESKEGPAS